MKTIRLSAMAALIAATALFTVSCGGVNSNKQQSSDIEQQIAEDIVGGIENVSSGAWVDNDHTRMVPKPDMAVSESASTGMGYSIVFGRNVTLEQMKAYVGKLKEAGFNVDCGDQQEGGIYSFWGDNAAGWSVRITVTSNANNLLISKPGEM